MGCKWPAAQINASVYNNAKIRERERGKKDDESSLKLDTKSITV